MAALVYSASTLAVLVDLWLDRPWFRDTNWSEIALVAATGLFVIASIRIFARRRFADLTALVAALLGWPGFRWMLRWSPWLAFNMLGTDRDFPDLHREFLFAGLMIVLPSVLAAATAWSALRLTPRTWRFRKLSVRDCIWPGFAATLLFVAVWYVRAVTPYQIPITDLNSNPPSILVLRVEKHGLHFHETSLAVYPHHEFYLAHDDRRLFQYSFQRSLFRGVIAEEYFDLIDSLADSPPPFIGSTVSRYIPPRAWNAGRWFVFVEVGPKPVKIEVSVMPKTVLDLFHDAQKSPLQLVQQETRRDVCFGFCYNPTY